ncbi:hypothetical protein QBC43DRAFT_318057 [Cladorrhinum sp. PSN259]|nr:hypothetical protein QBC43DRAFT_318057 [Cladorrhinum sp. PSN259]
MAFLNPEPQTFTGGCMCSSIRYTISVPALPSRSLIPRALPTPLDSQGTNKVDTRFPLVFIDHCQDCRRACGALLQCWFICPLSWVKFELRPQDGTQEPQSYPASEIVAKPIKSITDTTHLGYYNSSPKGHRCFCKRCGTPFSWFSTQEKPPGWEREDTVDIAVGSFDQESLNRVRPDRQGWWEHGTEWIKNLVSKGDDVLIRHPDGRLSQEVGRR